MPALTSACLLNLLYLANLVLKGRPSTFTGIRSKFVSVTVGSSPLLRRREEVVERKKIVAVITVTIISSPPPNCRVFFIRQTGST
jgi:hypothetical protein